MGQRKETEETLEDVLKKAHEEAERLRKEKQDNTEGGQRIISLDIPEQEGLDGIIR